MSKSSATLPGLVASAAFLVSALAMAQPASTALEAATNACNSAPPPRLTVELDDGPALFETARHLKFPSMISREVTRADIWVDRQLQTRIESQELRSFEAFGNEVSIPFVIKLPSSDARTEGDDHVLQLKPTAVNEVDVILYSEPTPGQLRCGSAHYSMRTKAVDTFAIAIGFNYGDTPFELKYAQNDAEDIVRHYLDHIKVKPENVWLFTDDAQAASKVGKPINIPADSSAQAIRTLVEKIKLSADPQSRLFVYYSGHMLIADGLQGIDSYFFLAQSTPELTSSQLDRRQFLNELIGLPMASTVVILDACYSGSSDTPQAVYPGDSSTPRSKSSYPAPNISVPNPTMDAVGQPRLTLSSSSGTTPSWELDEFKHGVFTYYLLKAAEGAPGITIGEAYDKATDAMGVLKPVGWKLKLPQHPDEFDAHDGHRIVWKRQ